MTYKQSFLEYSSKKHHINDTHLDKSTQTDLDKSTQTYNDDEYCKSIESNEAKGYDNQVYKAGNELNFFRV